MAGLPGWSVDTADGAEVASSLDAVDPKIAVEDLARRCGARGIPLTWTGSTYSSVGPATPAWMDLIRRRRAEGQLTGALPAGSAPGTEPQPALGYRARRRDLPDRRRRGARGAR